MSTAHQIFAACQEMAETFDDRELELTLRCEECREDKPLEKMAMGYNCDICLACDALIQARKTESCAVCKLPVDPEDSFLIDGLHYCEMHAREIFTTEDFLSAAGKNQSLCHR